MKIISLIALAALAAPAVLAFQQPAPPAAPAAPPAGAAASECQLGGVKVPGFAVAQIPPAQFNTLHKAVAPAGETERWMEIPWESDLWAAKQRAAREGKPLLMWIMDGHPLGCT
jgi:hypothetical protein